VSVDPPAPLWNACRINEDDKRLIDSKYILDLDDFGFPVVALANQLLIQQADFGESREALEENWQAWLHHNPFDAAVARRLADIHRWRLSRLNPETDPGAVQRLKRKIRQTEGRVRRYTKTAFEPS
jgi:hypothetical protein